MINPCRFFNKRQIRPHRERLGAVLILTAVMLVVIVALVALAVDLGYVALVRAQLQAAADSAALAGASQIAHGFETVFQTADRYARYHTSRGEPLRLLRQDVQLGVWDAATRTFTPTEDAPNAVRVVVRRDALVGNPAPLFFARALGQRSVDLSAEAIAMANPRDIAFVVDLSGSMNDDTEPAWATDVINSTFGSSGYGSIGTELMQQVYQDFGFGSFPGRLEHVGAPWGVPQNDLAYAELTKDGGPLSQRNIPPRYRINRNDDELTRKVKAYSAIIDYQIARVMPNVRPAPDSSRFYSYWEKYLDYIIKPVRVPRSSWNGRPPRIKPPEAPPGRPIDIRTDPPPRGEFSSKRNSVGAGQSDSPRSPPNSGGPAPRFGSPPAGEGPRNNPGTPGGGSQNGPGGGGPTNPPGGGPIGYYSPTDRHYDSISAWAEMVRSAWMPMLPPFSPTLAATVMLAPKVEELPPNRPGIDRGNDPPRGSQGSKPGAATPPASSAPVSQPSAPGGPNPEPPAPNGVNISPFPPFWSIIPPLRPTPPSRGLVWLPPNQSPDRITGMNNPNRNTFPAARPQLPERYLNKIGYLTYVQFMMDFGRDLKPDGVNFVPLSRRSPYCPFHLEETAGGTFRFPPREQPTHAARRALIAAIQVVKERNSGIPDPSQRDWVSIVTYDSLSGGGPIVAQPLTGDYDRAMEVCTHLQACGDKGASTATEAGLLAARNHLKPRSQGGAGRRDTNKVVILLTDGVPNLFVSSPGEIQSFISQNPSPEYYAGNALPYNAALVQVARMQLDHWSVFPVGVGLGTDYNFMDRLARLGGTADDEGRSPRGSGNPAEYESRLREIFERIIHSPKVRLVK